MRVELSDTGAVSPVELCALISFESVVSPDSSTCDGIGDAEDLATRFSAATFTGSFNFIDGFGVSEGSFTVVGVSLTCGGANDRERARDNFALNWDVI